MGKFSFSLGQARPGTRDLMIFCRQFAVMNNAGITLPESLRLFSKQTEQPVLRERLQAVVAGLEKGNLLAASLALHDDIFPPLLLNMIKAGEEGGALDTVLDRLALHFEKQYDLEQKIKAATLYPKFLIGFTFLAAVFILVFVLPNFVGIFENMGLAVPLITRLLFTAGEILTANWYFIVLFLLAAFFWGRQYLQTEKGGHYFDRLRLAFPFYSSFYRKVATARFCRVMGILLGSGISLLSALELVKDILDNRIMAAGLQSAGEKIMQGRSLAGALAATGFILPLAVEMVHVGELTGSLDNLLLKAADFYEADLAYTIERLQAMLEPVLIISVAGIIAFFALSVFLPIFEMYQLL